MVGFEPTISCSRSTRSSQTFPHSDNLKASSENRTRNFSLARKLGYHYTMDAFCWLNQIVKDQEHRVRIELTQPLYESGVIPLDHQCLFIQWDRWVSNPHRRFKRPVHNPVCHNPICFVFQSAWKESNLLLTSYKDAALTTELHAVMSEAGGIRTHALQIKSPLCCRYTTTS